MSRAFIKAVEAGRVIQAKQLHRQGISLNSKNHVGYPALFLALRIHNANARVSMVSWLLVSGADTGYVDPLTGRNLLTAAAYLNCTAEIQLLLDHGSQDVVAQDYRGRTALHYATIYNNVSAIYELSRYSRRYCIPVSHADHQGWTPFAIATVLCYNHARSLLVRIGGDASEQFIFPSMNLRTLRRDYHEFHWFSQGNMLRQRRKFKPKSAPATLRKSPPETLLPRLNTSCVNDTTSTSSSGTSLDYITQYLSVQSAEKSPSYRSRAVEPVPEKPVANLGHRASLSFAMVAKIATVALSMRKKRTLMRQDSKLSYSRSESTASDHKILSSRGEGKVKT